MTVIRFVSDFLPVTLLTRQIPRSLWRRARRFHRTLERARADGTEEALRGTVEAGQLWAKLMRVANHKEKKAWLKKKTGILEKKMDRLISLNRIQAQLALFDVRIRPGIVGCR